MHLRLPALLLVLMTAMFGSSIAAADMVRYDFTGRVIGNWGSFSSLPNEARNISGSVTIDFDASLTAMSYGSPASGDWQRSARGGTEFGEPTLSAVVVSHSLTVNGVTYSSDPISSLNSSSVVRGFQGTGSLSLLTGVQQIGGPLMFFSLTLHPSGGVTTYLSNGLPNLAAIAADSQGTLTLSMRDELRFLLTSLTAASPIPPGGQPVPLTPVPLPTAAWLLLSGLAALGSIRKRAAATG